MTHKRKYPILLSGDAEVTAFLKRTVPMEWDKLGDARERARAIELLFPGVQAQAISVSRRPDAYAVKRL